MNLNRLAHLSKRFLISLSPVAPSKSDTRWAEAYLWAGERTLFAALPNHDRRHLIGVARRVDSSLGELSEERWIAAALLHDVGKSNVHMNPIGRAMATIWIEIKGLDALSRSEGRWSKRVYLYSQHPSLGCDDIRRWGGHEEAAIWAGAHQDRSLWPATGFAAFVIEALTEADDD